MFDVWCDRPRKGGKNKSARDREEEILSAWHLVWAMPWPCLGHALAVARARYDHRMCCGWSEVIAMNRGLRRCCVASSSVATIKTVVIPDISDIFEWHHYRQHRFERELRNRNKMKQVLFSCLVLCLEHTHTCARNWWWPASMPLRALCCVVNLQWAQWCTVVQKCHWH